MYFQPDMTQRLAEEHFKELLREAEQYRLSRRAARGSRKARGRWPSVALMLSALLGLIIRPQG